MTPLFLDKLLDIIDAKIDYELARREVGSDGHYSSASDERKRVEQLAELLKNMLLIHT